MIKIGRAIEKAVGEDIRNYISANENVTNNALLFLRGDYIHTNIKKVFENRETEIKFLNKTIWRGVVLIDREE